MKYLPYCCNFFEGLYLIECSVTKSHKYLSYHGQKNFTKIAYGELFVISVIVKYMHGELLAKFCGYKTTLQEAGGAI